MSKRAQRSYSPFARGEGDKNTDTKCSLKLIEIEMKTLLYEVDFGGFRRRKIYELMKNGVEVRVNGLHELQTKNDPDLKRLLKEGKIEMCTTAGTSYNAFKRTFLRYKDNGSR